MSSIVDYEVDDNNIIVTRIKNSQASQLFVEFLQQGGPKPHVVLRLNINQIIELDGNRWMGCRLAIDLVGGDDGVFHITPLPYDNASHAAHAAFEFQLTKPYTVGQIISTIQQPQTDLLDFCFTGGFTQPGSRIEYYDGCRDFISQFFICLHLHGVVRWQIYRVDRGNFNSNNLKVIPNETGFHEIIGYNFKTAGNTTVVEYLPLARGTFLNFTRTVRYGLYHLPYNPSTPQPGDRDFVNPTYDPNPEETTETYSTEWQRSEEKKCWWRIISGNYEYVYDNTSASSSTEGQSSSRSFLEGTVREVKRGILVCDVDGATKRLPSEEFHWDGEIQRYVYVGRSGVEYRLHRLSP